MARPPKPATQRTHKPPPNPISGTGSVTQELDFDKSEWIRELKVLQKDANIEERDRFRPLLKMKNDSRQTLDELGRLEKKYEIDLMRERDQLRQFGTK